MVGDAVGGAWNAATEGVSSAWNWAFGDDEDEAEEQERAQTRQLVKKVQRSGKVIPFPEGGKAGLNSSQSRDYPPLQAAPPRVNQTEVNTKIVVNAAPGMSEKELARQVELKLRERERSAQARQRGALYDYSDIGGA